MPRLETPAHLPSDPEAVRDVASGAAPGLAAPPARATLADVARSAGVSQPTVSKVLNDRGDVAPETRDRVQQALRAVGYQRRGGRGPGAQRRREGALLVELVLSDLDSPYALEVLAGAEEGAAAAGAGLVVTAVHGRRAGGGRWLSRLEGRRSAGVVLVVSNPAPEAAAELRRLSTPLVLLDPVGSRDPELPTVGATNWSGGLAATQHLLDLGHRRIAVISGDPALACSQERVEGYRAALGRAGVPVDEALVRFGDFSPEGGRREGGALLDLADPPTAVFAGSDVQSSGVYQEARSRGVSVPEDLSVVGFDDLSLCQVLSPPLTTVRQPLADMAAHAVRMALDAALEEPAVPGAGSGPPQHLQLATSLVVRESTCPPRS
ncbi:LacI family DNA-binding transcriptional regulator [uncultured Pseudokineococcus sp.]|uniref:LacI family DNA-binding transcriptional regulator n=1 Tax=uncultured Pseudokineococcus sp. TaxID=1642928 RepID=UPI0026195AB9|nr:substrate-binding domain-containing protein [uncultured Pseudokineococcus sp.]